MEKLDEDTRLALRLLDATPPEAVLMLPSALDNNVRELEDRGFAEIVETSGIPLATITDAGRKQREEEQASASA